jgi:hypothetical protein
MRAIEEMPRRGEFVGLLREMCARFDPIDVINVPEVPDIPV